MDITHITSLLGGIALFLYGMSIMGAGLEKLAGGKMQGVLQKLTSSTIKGVIFGTLITGVIQSSAGTVVICVGLVNSGIMTLTQSVGVIMGANIGTTVTGQLIRMADISGESLLPSSSPRRLRRWWHLSAAFFMCSCATPKRRTSARSCWASASCSRA